MPIPRTRPTDPAAPAGALLVAGTASDAGKSLLTAGICRWLRREGVRVAPFKAQNMALNSAVTPDGREIGRAQAMQAAAAGIAPEAAMNPVLLKPTSDRTSQVILLGRPHGTADARYFQGQREELRTAVLDSLADLRARFDAVICEGAGSPAEINLRSGDFVNMGLARAAGLPTIVIGDIDRGGALAAHYGTIALLEPADQALVAGMVINKFRGDLALLTPGLKQLEQRTGRPVLGVLPWTAGLELDSEDGLGLTTIERHATDATAPPVRVVVLRLGHASNVTDLDALTIEPRVDLRVSRDPGAVREADLVVLPGSKSTVADLQDLRDRGLDRALAARAAAGGPILGICGGYQMLGTTIEDDGIEAGTGTVPGLGLLPVHTVMSAEKITRRRSGRLRVGPDGTVGDDGDALPAGGYEIRHGRVVRTGGIALLHADPVAPAAGERETTEEGCVVGATVGTSWHGLLEHDEARRSILRFVARRSGRPYRPGTAGFAATRERRLDTLGDLVAEHLDTDALLRLLQDGAPGGLPTLACGPMPASGPRAGH